MGASRLGTDYQKLWVATTVSNLGDGVVLAALPLLAVTFTRDPALIAGVAIAAGLPWLLFPLVAGALVDRWDRRLVMGVVDILRTVVFAALGFAVLMRWANLALLYVVAFVTGTAETFFDNASQAMLPSIVEHQHLEHANSRMYASELMANQLAGPPFGSFLFVAAASIPFFFDAGTFAVAGVLALALRPRARPQKAGGSLHAEIGEGLVWLWRHRLLRSLAIMLGAWNLVNTAVLSVFVLYALEVLDVGKAGFGWLLATASIGGFAGGLLGPRISARLGVPRALVLTVALTASTSVILGMTSSYVVAGLMIATEAFAGLVWNVITVSLRQTIVPSELLGRVNSVYRMVGWGTMPLGGVVGAALARGFGLRAPFLVAAAVAALIAVAVARVVTAEEVARARGGGVGVPDAS